MERDQFDLLTAMIMGVAIGTAATYLLRRGPRGRPIATVVSAAGRGASVAGRHGARGARWAGGQAARGAGWLGDRGGQMWDRVPREEIAEEVGDYLTSAREAINDTVAHELADLRKAIRRQRKRLGV